MVGKFGSLPTIYTSSVRDQKKRPGSCYSLSPCLTYDSFQPLSPGYDSCVSSLGRALWPSPQIITFCSPSSSSQVPGGLLMALRKYPASVCISMRFYPASFRISNMVPSSIVFSFGRVSIQHRFRVFSMFLPSIVLNFKTGLSLHPASSSIST